MKIDQSQLKKRLDQKLSKFIKDTEYVSVDVLAIDLLTAERFDLLAKYIYIKFKDLGINSDFGRDLYIKHIWSLNCFLENDESGKFGEESFIKSFDNLIESIKQNGLEKNTLIPLSPRNIIVDGAHRTAIGLYYNIKLPCITLKYNSHVFDYRFFENRGLDRVYLDAMASEYAKLKDDVYMILLWPSAEKKDFEVNAILNDYGKIIYRKDISLNNNGAVNLVYQVYIYEEWIGHKKNDYIGARNKARWCFSKKGALRVVLFESQKDLNKMKKEIRRIYNIDKHAVHINDTKEEALKLAGMLFNENSIHWMNHSLLKEFTWHRELFHHYKNWIQKSNKNNDYFCIDGSCVLSVYGIREARDLDYLYFGENCLETGFREIACHNDESQYYVISRDDIIFNPINHFLIENLKYVSIQNIKKMKIKRNQEKDIRDVEFIESILINEKITRSLYGLTKMLMQPSYWMGKMKFSLLKLRFYYTKIKLFIKS